ncbi:MULTISPECIES: hypothetical protein [unclassified Mesorhizobium]|uniref:DUF1127 domain-containing protein n=1 Tax=Mesorhizobium TaxID=68287 RepID=UPI0003CE5385|nr:MULTISPECIES: hypothetical protein [unclassified Mesorhizobium]ESY89814.1 hypothetical protein X741_29860 [Mesorhizobium sp. LNHC229A00]ESY92683.1 hypothetical protein X738_26855 [Mesorhizobium sp. LNHC209A00]
MTTTPTSLSDVYGAMRLDPSERQPTAAGRTQNRSGLKSLVKEWSDRAYFRHQLACMATNSPELIDDIGLTLKQVEAEIAKPFWRE